MITVQLIRLRHYLMSEFYMAQTVYSSLTYGQQIVKASLKFLCCKEQAQHNESCFASATMDDLDDNLLCEILTRVPAKTVGRFMIINKRWYSLIRNNFFVVKHAGCQSERNASGLFYMSQSAGSIDHVSFDLSSPTQTFSLDLPEGHQTNWLSIRTICNGLVLLSLHNCKISTMYIFNPIIKKTLCIPCPAFGKGAIFGYGLAVDQLSFQLYNHYKVVCLYRDSMTYQFKIFTPDTGCWSSSKETISYYKESPLLNHISMSPIYFRGALHWLTNKGDILAFDVDKEQSWMIKIPGRIIKLVSRRPWFDLTWLGVVEDQLNLIAINHKEAVNWVPCDYEDKKWKIKRRFKRMWRNDNNEGFLPVPIFYDGERLVLQVASVYVTRIYNIYDLQIHNLRTGAISDTIHLEHSFFFPNVGTLIGL